MTRLELESKLSKAEMVSRDFALGDIVRALTAEASSGDKSATGAAMEKQDVLSVLDNVLDEL